jgi:hypothetical protein
MMVKVFLFPRDVVAEYEDFTPTTKKVMIKAKVCGRHHECNHKKISQAKNH